MQPAASLCECESGMGRDLLQNALTNAERGRASPELVLWRAVRKWEWSRDMSDCTQQLSRLIVLLRPLRRTTASSQASSTFVLFRPRRAQCFLRRHTSAPTDERTNAGPIEIWILRPQQQHQFHQSSRRAQLSSSIHCAQEKSNVKIQRRQRKGKSQIRSRVYNDKVPCTHITERSTVAARLHRLPASQPAGAASLAASRLHNSSAS